MMRHDEPIPVNPDDLAAGLERLGVRELEERLELSPLFAGGEMLEPSACRCTCDCDDVPPDPLDPELLDRIVNTRPFGGPVV